jgi:hypothetical protein
MVHCVSHFPGSLIIMGLRTSVLLLLIGCEQSRRRRTYGAPCNPKPLVGPHFLLELQARLSPGLEGKPIYTRN